MKPHDHDPLDDLVRRKLQSNDPNTDGLWDALDREFDKRDRRRFFTWSNLAIALLLLSLVLGGIRFYDTTRTTIKPDGSVNQVHENQNSSRAFSNAESKNESRDIDARQQSDNGERTIDPHVSPTRSQTLSSERTEPSEHSNRQLSETDATTTLTDSQTEQPPTIEAHNQIASEYAIDTFGNQQLVVRDSIVPVRTLDAQLFAFVTPLEMSLANQQSTSRWRKRAKLFNWQVGAQAQLLWVSKSVESDDGSSEAYVTRRKTEERSALASAYGLRLGVEVKRVVLQTGIGYRNFTEKIEYFGRSPVLLVQATSYTPNVLYDTTEVRKENSDLSAGNGSYANRYLEIPVMLGYRIGNESISVQPMVGLTWNKPVDWQSRYFDRTLTGLAETRSELAPSVSSWMFELHASQSLGSRMRVHTFGVYHLNRASVLSNGIDQRYRSIGGGVGLTYRF